jgi:hypothetical protein
MHVFLWILVVGGFIVGIYDYNREFASDLEATTLGFADISIILTGLLGLSIRSILIRWKSRRGT